MPQPLERARGEARLTVRFDGGRSRLDRLYQAGAAKIRLPRVGPDAPLEAVLINTAGGVTGGDRLSYRIEVGGDAEAVVATQAAERVYRRRAGVASIETHLSVAAGGHLDWLPQETILFNRSGLSRRLSADIGPEATLLAVEAIILGRTAMGEIVDEVFATDSWRIRQGGKLLFADGLRLDGDASAIMAGGATGQGAVAFATLVLVSPRAESMIDLARTALAGGNSEAGASAWNGILIARLIAATGQALRADLVRLVEALRAGPMPRVWQC